MLVTQRMTKAHGSYNGMWVFPGGYGAPANACQNNVHLTTVPLLEGKVDIGETAEEGALREFEEETGLRLIDGSIRTVALWQPQDGRSAKTYLMVCYTGVIAGHDSVGSALKALRMQPDEVAQGTFLPPETWPQVLPEVVRGLVTVPGSPTARPRAVPSIKVAPERNEKGKPVYLTGEVPVQSIADGLGGGHQFALYQLAINNQVGFDHDFLRQSSESPRSPLGPRR